MFGKNKNDEENKLDSINKKTINELLSSDRPSVFTYYRWNKEDTRAVLKKCSTLKHYILLHRAAFKAYLFIDRNDNFRVTEETLDIIYENLIKPFTAFLKDNDSDRYEYMGKIKELCPNLDTPWLDAENSCERELLRTRLIARWKEVSRELFISIKEKSPTDIKKYEALFRVCKKDDPIVLEIADEINKLS